MVQCKYCNYINVGYHVFSIPTCMKTKDNVRPLDERKCLYFRAAGMWYD